MNTHVKSTITQHALSVPDEEVCGFIVRGKGFVSAIPCPNVADPSARAHEFEIEDAAYIAAQRVGVICGFYHSHPTGPAAFSEVDITMADELGLPMHLVALNKSGAAPEWLIYVPKSYRVDPIGREFAWGEADCLETVRIYHRQERSIYLTDYERDESFRETQSDAIIQGIEREGFTNLGANPSAAQVGDVLLFNTDGRRFPHHLAIFTGRNHVLHHPYGSLSRVDDLDERWLRHLVGVLRYTKS